MGLVRRFYPPDLAPSGVVLRRLHCTALHALEATCSRCSTHLFPLRVLVRRRRPLIGTILRFQRARVPLLADWCTQCPVLSAETVQSLSSDYTELVTFYHDK